MSAPDDETITALRALVRSVSISLDDLERFVQMARTNRLPGPVVIERAEHYVDTSRADIAKLTNLLYMLSHGDDSVRH